jgi:hypothetical protein
MPKKANVVVEPPKVENEVAKDEVAKEPTEENVPILAPKPKRILTEAQRAGLEKGRLTRDENRKKRLEEKDNYVKQLQEKKVNNMLKEKEKLKKIIGVESDAEAEAEAEAEEEEVIVKKRQPKKKKVIVLPESDDDVEEEIIYKKSKKAVSLPSAQPVVPKIVFF